MRTKLLWFMACLVAAVIIAVPLAYVAWRDQRPSNDDQRVIYRSGQISASQLQQLLTADQIRTVVNLREDE
jgi:hypothetical protein